jgi:hypothetical protein
MRNRLMLGVLGAAAVSVVALGIGGNASAAPKAQKSVTFHLTEVSHAFNYIDNPPKQGPNAPPLIGDEFMFSSELKTASGAHAGWLEATCVIAIGGKRSSGPCYGVFALKGGTLMGMALTKFYGNAPNEIAIVGGTGVYAGATGIVKSVTKSENVNEDTVTLHWAT